MSLAQTCLIIARVFGPLAPVGVKPARFCSALTAVSVALSNVPANVIFVAA